jgi:hypothetical protein
MAFKIGSSECVLNPVEESNFNFFNMPLKQGMKKEFMCGRYFLCRNAAAKYLHFSGSLVLAY